MYIDKVRKDLQDAILKNSDQPSHKVKIETLRSILTAFTNAKAEANREFNDEIAVKTLKKLIKQRQMSIEAYLKADRPELAGKEVLEQNIIQFYLPEEPELIDSETMKAIVRHTIAISDGKLNMGGLINTVKADIQERGFSVDMKLLAQEIKSQL